MTVSNYFLLKFWILLWFLCSSQLFGSINDSFDQKFNNEDFNRRLDRIQSGITNLRASLINIPEAESPLLPTNTLKRISEREVIQLSSPSKKAARNKTSLTISPKESKLKGFYLLPFVGMQSSTNLEWGTFGGQVEIDLKNGLSTGLRIGYNWYDLFSEFQLSYLRNDIKGINQALKISGEIDGLGFYLTSGGRINFNESLSGVLGIGAGGFHQQLHLSLAGTPLEQKEFLFSSNIFLGVEYSPIDRFIIGLRYRMMLIDEMNSFSKRYLNSVELTAGYLF